MSKRNWNNFYRMMFFPLFGLLLISLGINYLFMQDQKWYRQEAYDSWKIQQDYFELLQGKIDTCHNTLVELDKQYAITYTKYIIQRDGDDFNEQK